MSGLCEGRRRVWSSFRQQPFAPRMLRPRRDGLPSAANRFSCSGLHGPRGERVNAERPALVRDPHRPVHVLFHQHVGGPEGVVDLLEPPLMREGDVLAQAPGRLDAEEHAVQRPACQPRPMQIGGLGRLDREAPIVERQPLLHEPIRCLERGDSRQAQLFHQAILNRLEQPLHPPLGLRRVGRDQLDPQLTQRPPKLTRGLYPRQLVFHGGLGRRLIGRMLVRVDGQRNPLLRHRALEAVQRRDGAFVRIESGQDPAARIVDVGHQHPVGAPALQPVMVRAIQLDEFPHVGFPLPPRPMRAPPPREMLAPAATAVGSRH